MDHPAGEPSEQLPEDQVEGQRLYAEKCGMCHDHGDAGSPRVGNVKQWSKRVQQGEETLTKHAIVGFEGKWGEMPPQGDDLSPEEVAAAVDYIVYRYQQAAKTE